MDFNFNWRSRRFIGSIILAILTGLGVGQVPGVSGALTDVACAAVECEDESARSE